MFFLSSWLKILYLYYIYIILIVIILFVILLYNSFILLISIIVIQSDINSALLNKYVSSLISFIYLSNNRLKRLKIYNYYNKAKEISLIKYKSQIYYNYYNNIFNDNRNIIFFDSFYTTNKIKTLIL